MKYFKPDLLARLNSADERTSDAASEQWDAARNAYEQSLEKIRPLLPVAILDTHFHDAKIGRGLMRGRVYFIFVLTEDRQSLEIDYLLSAAPSVVQHPPLSTSKQVFWWYDEIEKANDGFVHSILMSNGVELRIPFLKVQVSPVEFAKAVVPDAALCTE